MRGIVDGLATPQPLGPALPGLYQEDLFAQRLMEAFDGALAPVFTTLDNLAAYLDPALTPDDFLDWLATWVAAVIDDTWDEARRRRSIAQAADLYRRRGTALGLAAQVELVTGGAVEVIENGATGWSIDPGVALPGTARASLTIRVKVPDPAAIDTARLDRLVASAKPAHVPHSIEVAKG
jgi:phage tail-like protein